MLKVLRVGLAAAVAAAIAGCIPLSTFNALVESDTHEMITAAYGASSRQHLDVYVPVEMHDRVRPAQGWPVVVFFYGGSWKHGQRADYRFVGEALAARGIVAVIPDYRLYPEVRYPEFLRDNAAATAWALREAERFGADPTRVFVMGHSAGGYNAAMVALDARWLGAESIKPTQLAGWIGLAGPYEFLPIENADVRPVFLHPNTPPESEPLWHVSASVPRTFLAAAPDDDLINPERNTKQLASKLQKTGIPVTLQIYPHASHTTLIGAFAFPLRFLAPVLDDVVDFVKASPKH
jgi:acetyl esterase/lipase